MKNNMEAIISFFASLSGTITALYFYHFFRNLRKPINTPSKEIRTLLEPLQGLKNKVNKPHGVVLHSPTAEEERKEKWDKFKQLVEEKRQKMGVIEDYRKV